MDGPHIVLCDQQRSRGVQHVGSGAPILDHSRRRRIDNGSIGGDHPGEKQFGDHLDDARSADADNLDFGGGRSRDKAWVVGPQFAADHFEPRLQRVPVDADPLDGPNRGPLPARNLGSLERRTGGARRGEEPVTVAENDLGVGTDVDE